MKTFIFFCRYNQDERFALCNEYFTVIFDRFGAVAANVKMRLSIISQSASYFLQFASDSFVF